MKEIMGIRLKDLSKLGYTNNVARSLAVAIVNKHCKYESKEEILVRLANVLDNPEAYKKDEVWGKLAEHFSPTIIERKFQVYDLREVPLMHQTYGKSLEKPNKKGQMSSLRLSIRRLRSQMRPGEKPG